jgi:hypothetical protein
LFEPGPLVSPSARKNFRFDPLPPGFDGRFFFFAMSRRA